MAIIADSKNKRLAQFELLRILAMLGVLMNHVFNYGLHIYDGFTVDTSTVTGMLLWSILELMKLIALPSVNCYILITGYFLVNTTHLRIKGIWRVWSITWFYAVFIYLIAVCCGICPFEWNIMLRHATPLLSNSYWFVTTYIILMILAPLLSWALQRLSLRQYQFTLIVGGVVCFQPLLGWAVMDGQQILLFVYLFIIGGYIRRYADKTTLSWQKTILYILLMLVSMYAYTVYKNIHIGNHDFHVFAMAYHGLVLPLSIGIFLFFKDLHITNEKLTKAICMIASLSFSVYIIHTQSVVDKILWDFSAHVLNNITQPMTIPLVCVLICIIVFSLCCCIDYFRSSFVASINQGFTQLADDFHFSDQAGFTKFFTRMKSISPKEFRKGK